jgi:hypothetical protein
VTHPGLAEPRTKEDWRDYVHYEPPPRPVLPTRTAYQAMREDEWRRFDRARSRHHSALVLAWTPPVQRFETEIFERLEANQAAPAGARPGLLIDGPAAVGKSTLVKMIARKFELQLRADEPHRVTDTVDNHVPVVYLSVPDQVTPKQISLALARYLHLPTRGTKDDIDDVVLKAIRRCDVQLLVIDDLHFLDCGQREGRASNDHIKYLANHAPCTLVGTGIDLEDSPLLSEGGGAERATQTAGSPTTSWPRSALPARPRRPSGSAWSRPWKTRWCSSSTSRAAWPANTGATCTTARAEASPRCTT